MCSISWDMHSHTAPLMYQVYMCLPVSYCDLKYAMFSIKSICVYLCQLLWSKICHVQWTLRHAFFAVQFCIKLLSFFCPAGAAAVSNIFFFPYFTLQNICALHVLQYTVIWHISCWVCNIWFFWDVMLCHWLCSSRFSLWATWSWRWRHYVGYSESKHRLRVSLAHPRDCHFAHMQWLPISIEKPQMPFRKIRVMFMFVPWVKHV